MDLKDDALRCRFTAWMKVVVKRAKIDYIRQMDRQAKLVSLETITEEEICTYSDFNTNIKSSESFEFEDDNITEAFLSLSLFRQKILTLMFVQGKTADQVAKIVGRSVKHVFNEKSLALKQIRENLRRKQL